MNTNNVFFFERLKPSMISVIWNPNLPENFQRRAESLFHRQSRSVSNFRTRTWNDFKIPKSPLSSSSKWSSKSSSSSPPADENFRSMILVKIRKKQLEKTCKVDPAPFQQEESQKKLDLIYCQANLRKSTCQSIFRATSYVFTWHVLFLNELKLAPDHLIHHLCHHIQYDLLHFRQRLIFYELNLAPDPTWWEHSVDAYSPWKDISKAQSSSRSRFQCFHTFAIRGSGWCWIWGRFRHPVLKYNTICMLVLL